VVAVSGVTVNLTFYARLYLLTVSVFFAIDMLRLGYAAKGFNRQNLQRFLGPDVSWAAALIFYLLYFVGVLFFAVAPAVEKGSLRRAALLGGLFGFFTYATYELTNLATRRPVQSSLSIEPAFGLNYL
jgi:uncharacterized membrane protein